MLNNKTILDFQVYFLDLDGTLIDKPNHQISKQNLDIIYKLKKINKILVISTGRLPSAAISYFNLIKPSYLIASNGAIVLDKDLNLLLEKKIDIVFFNDLVNFFLQNKLAFKINDHFIAFNVTKRWQAFIATKIGYKTSPDIPKNVDYDLFKIVCWGKRKKNMLLLCEKLTKLFPYLEFVTSSNDWTIEITHKNATKGIASEFVLKKLNINKNDAIHFGDSMNDFTVIGYVGALAAMSSGSKKLYKKANYKLVGYKKGGFAKSFSKFI